jgi:glycosyltransferase involved in cell wall biosynthesis
MNKISVIIPTKDRTQDIARCLESITSQTRLPDEVLIVDSSDTEELKSTLDLFEGLNIKYIHIAVDKKFKGSQQIAMNVGLDNSTGDILIFLDDDVILDKEYVKNIARVFENDSEGKIGGVTGEVVAEDRQISPIKRFLILFNHVIPLIFFLLRPGDGRFLASGFPTVIKSGSVDELTECEFLYGCNMAFRKNIIAEFRFDENLNIHGCCFGDDDDTAYRISRKYQNIYTPFAKAVHNMSPVRANKYAKNRLMIINHHYLFKKNLPQDFKHKFAFWWSVVGLFVRETVMDVMRRNSSGVRGLTRGIIDIMKKGDINDG